MLLALSHTNAARDYPPAHAALRAFPLLTAPPHCSPRTPGSPGVNSGPEPGKGETWLWPKGRRLGAAPSWSSPPPGHFWGVGIISSRQGGGSARRPPASLSSPDGAGPRARPPRSMRWCWRLPAVARPLRRRLQGGR